MVAYTRLSFCLPCSDLGVGCFAASARDAGLHSSIIALLVLRLVSAHRYQDYNGGACTPSSSHRPSCSMSSVSRGKVDSTRTSVLYKHALNRAGSALFTIPHCQRALPKEDLQGVLFYVAALSMLRKALVPWHANLILIRHLTPLKGILVFGGRSCPDMLNKLPAGVRSSCLCLLPPFVPRPPSTLVNVGTCTVLSGSLRSPAPN